MTCIWNKAQKNSGTNPELYLLMAQVEGFEPPQDVNPLSVFKTDPFSRTWVNLHHSNGGSGRNRTSDTRIFSPLLYRLSYGTNWRSERGSNPRPPPWQGGILNQLNYQTILVAGEGFEPTTFGLWARRATRLLHPAICNLVDPAGLEPATNRLWAGGSNQLS